MSSQPNQIIQYSEISQEILSEQQLSVQSNDLTNLNNTDKEHMNSSTNLQSIQQYSEKQKQKQKQLYSNQEIEQKLKQEDKNILKKNLTSLKDLIQYTENSQQSEVFNQILSNYLLKNESLKIQCEQNILFNKKFTKSPIFTPKLLIKEMKKSRNCQTISITIQISFYNLQIKLLNRLQESSLHSSTDHLCSGGFGNIYIRNFNGDKYAIKCILFKNRSNQITSQIAMQQKIIFLKQVFKQYYFLKLFQQLRIGPKLKQIYGFDIVLFNNCIEFSMEVCKHISVCDEQIKTLKKDLTAMHLLNFVHRDIKPENVMFSQTFQKVVFIDFGGTEALAEGIGHKSLTKFYGTAGYLSKEALKLVDNKINLVDLYYNDYFALRKSIQRLQIKQRQAGKYNSIQQELVSYSSQGQNQSFKQQIRLLYIIFCLYNGQYTQFYDKWKQWQYLTESEDQMQKLIDFFIQIQPNDKLRSIFFQIFDQKLLEKQQYQQLYTAYKHSQYRCLFHKKQFKFKDYQYQTYIKLFKTIYIIQQQINQLQKTVELIIMSKLNIQNFIFNKETVQSNNKHQQLKNYSSQKSFILCFYVLLNYCTFSKNHYDATVQQKMLAVEIFFQKAIHQNIIQQQDTVLIFTCQASGIQLLALFFQYFALNIWSKLPLVFKNDALKMVLISLMLVGYPSNLRKAKIFLVNNFIKCEQSRQNQIIYFWKFYIITTSYSEIFYDKNEDSFYLLIQDEQIKQMQQFQKNFMMLNQNENQPQKCQNTSQLDQKQFYNLNCLFYIDAFVNFRSFDQKKRIKCKNKLKYLNYQKLNLSQKYIKQWQFCIFEVINMLFTQNANSIQKDHNKLITGEKLQEQQDSNGFPLLSDFCLKRFINGTRYDSIILDILSFIDRIINYSLISERLCLNERILIAYKQKKWETFGKLLNLLIQNATYSTQFQMDQIIDTILMVKFILINFLDQLRRYNIFNFIDIYLIVKLIDKAKEFAIYYCGYGLQKFIFICTCSDQDSLQKSSKQQKIAENQSNLCSNRKRLKQNASFIYKILRITKSLETVCNLMISVKKAVYKLKAIVNQNQLQYWQIFYENQSKYSFAQTLKSLKQFQTLYQKGTNLQEYFDQIQNQMKTHLSQIKKNPVYIQAARSYSQIANRYVDIQIQGLKGPDKHKRMIQIVEQRFGHFQAGSFINNSFSCCSNRLLDNKIILPIPQTIYLFLTSRIVQSNYSNQQYKLLLKFYASIAQGQKMDNFWFNTFRIQDIYLGMIYCSRPFQEIHYFLLSITNFFYNYPIQENIHSFIVIFKKKFQGDCKCCFPKALPQGWSFQRLTDYFSSQTKYLRPNEECYMSLIYSFCLQNMKLKVKTIKILLSFIVKSLSYLCYFARELIKSKIDLFVLIILQKQKENYLGESYSLKSIKLNQKILRNKQHEKDIDELIELRFYLRKKEYGQKYSIPYKYESRIRQKLRRYHQVKQNFKISSGKVSLKIKQQLQQFVQHYY